MKKEVNIVLKTDIDALKQGFSEGIKATKAAGKTITKEMGEAIAGIEKGFASIATSKNSARAVKQLQNMAMTMRELGPEFQSVADDMIRRAGGIKDAFGDVGAEIAYFASDTRQFDSIISGLQGVAGAFAVVEGSLAMAGVENEDLQKTLVKLAGAMAVIQGLQEVQNVLQAESAFRIGVTTAAQKAYNMVVGQSVGAMKNFKIALATTGVGALVVGLGLLAQKFSEVKSSAEEAELRLNTFKNFMKRSDDLYKGEIKALERQLELDLKRAEIAGKSEKEIQKIKADSYDKQIALLRQSLATLDRETSKYITREIKAGKTVAVATQEGKKNEAEQIKIINDQILELENRKVDEQLDLQLTLKKARDKDIEDRKKQAKELLDLEAKINEDGAKSKPVARGIGEFAQTSTGVDPLKPQREAMMQSDAELTDSEAEQQRKRIENAVKEVQAKRSTYVKEAELLKQRAQAQEEYQARMQAAAEAINQQFEQSMENTAVAFGNLIGDLANGTGGLEEFTNNILTIIADFLSSMGKALIAAAIATKAFQDLLIANPVAAIGAGIAAVAASVVVRNYAEQGPKFANGGIVSGPTYGLMGEYPNANRNPEVIAPLDKLKSMLGDTSGGGGYVAETTIKGKDLALVLRRYNEGVSRG